MVTHPASSPAAWGSSRGTAGSSPAADAWLPTAPPPTPLLPLREIVKSLHEAERGVPPRGRARQRLRGQVRATGAAAFPALLRALRSDHAGLVDWACDLLSCVTDAMLPELCTRLDAILIDPQVHDASKARILGLLADLQAPVPEQVLLADPEAMIRSSVRDLITDLSSEQAVEQALDLLFSQVPTEQLARFLAEVMRFGGEAAQPFLAAVVADRRTPRQVALDVAQQVRPLAPAKEPVRQAPPAGQPTCNPEPALAACRRYLQSNEPLLPLPLYTQRAVAATVTRAPDLAERCFRSLRWHPEASAAALSPRRPLVTSPARLLAFAP